jgi:hypothetical protein
VNGRDVVTLPERNEVVGDDILSKTHKSLEDGKRISQSSVHTALFMCVVYLCILENYQTRYHEVLKYKKIKNKNKRTEHLQNDCTENYSFQCVCMCVCVCVCLNLAK